MSQNTNETEELIYEILKDVYGVYFNESTRKRNHKHEAPDAPDVFEAR